MLTSFQRDHGGGIDAARAVFGGTRIGWIDLSTGINPVPYPIPPLPHDTWTALPDQEAVDALLRAARVFWSVPASAEIIAAPGASAAIAQIPQLSPSRTVCIPQPTYNEHAAAFDLNGWTRTSGRNADAQVVVHPNNPDGKLWSPNALPAPGAGLTIIDESFCDVVPEQSLMPLAVEPGHVILKSFGKFWGLAGTRLGFVIGDAALLKQLQQQFGPWAVSGPALHIGTRALKDQGWASETRQRLVKDSARLDALMRKAGADLVGGTTLFRLYHVDDASAWQERLARHRIWSRVFPYNRHWLRLGLPHGLHWPRLEQALS